MFIKAQYTAMSAEAQLKRLRQVSARVSVTFVRFLGAPPDRLGGQVCSSVWSKSHLIFGRRLLCENAAGFFTLFVVNSAFCVLRSPRKAFPNGSQDWIIFPCFFQAAFPK